MKNRLSWLLFVLAASELPFAEAMFCYDCIVDETDGLSDATTTCPGSLIPSQTNTCEGLYCVTVKSDYGDRGIVTSLACSNETFGYTGPILVNLCPYLNYVQSRYEFYLYNDTCCFTTSETQNSSSGSSIQYNRTTCGCDKDYCNGNSITHRAKTPGVAKPTTLNMTNGANAAAFANGRPSIRYISRLALITTNVIAAMPLILDWI